MYKKNRLQLARPKNRAKTVQFSKHAVICERDGELCLIVRAVNLRASLLIDVSVTGEVNRLGLVGCGCIRPVY